MSTKLSGNGIWESSNMMIPQHRERSVQQERETEKQVRPELTEDEQRELFGRLRSSWSNTLKVTVTFYDGRQYREISGIVSEMDQLYVKLELERRWMLLNFADVAGAEFIVE
ncbi:YolD-like family protein [Paenibacillus tyrfis]|uniref:YolD-like family protein n=1 Tax=Paenibacillus tyrfis TaxID=1501230 RepID=UPI0020A0A4CA|nr:YolD-like family protein [Paenibacillus tyrfis]MCP1306960.1 YolD-like family protein [Paenibacillus tyrfis]